MKDYSTFNDSPILYRNMRSIRNLGRSISDEKLDFLKGRSLGDVDIYWESGETRRKVRRIVEKRVCQDMYARCKHPYSNYNRYTERRRVSNHMKNIFGRIPEELSNMKIAC